MFDTDKGRFDAVIVLANLMDQRGRLNDETRARLERAIQLVQSGVAPLLVTSGWPYRSDSELAIGDVMRRNAIDVYGLDRDAVIAETTARDTVGDAVFTKLRLANPRVWSRIAIVTSAYHGARTLEIFSFVYGPAIQVALRTSVSSDTPALRAAEAESSAAFRRTFAGIRPGDDAAILARLRTDHPFYNGLVHPAIGNT
jgi:uncharacterized SAM-binding protein YcdF (DUF218 family)